MKLMKTNKKKKRYNYSSDSSFSAWKKKKHLYEVSFRHLFVLVKEKADVLCSSLSPIL